MLLPQARNPRCGMRMLVRASGGGRMEEVVVGEGDLQLGAKPLRDGSQHPPTAGEHQHRTPRSHTRRGNVKEGAQARDDVMIGVRVSRAKNHRLPKWG